MSELMSGKMKEPVQQILEYSLISCIRHYLLISEREVLFHFLQERDQGSGICRLGVFFSHFLEKELCTHFLVRQPLWSIFRKHPLCSQRNMRNLHFNISHPVFCLLIFLDTVLHEFCVFTGANYNPPDRQMPVAPYFSPFFVKHLA